jgi:hypothetical protein
MAAQQSIDDSYTTAAYLVEKDLGVTLTPDYPALKFKVQVEELEKDYRKQNDEMKRSGSGSKRFRR